MSIMSENSSIESENSSIQSENSSIESEKSSIVFSDSSIVFSDSILEFSVIQWRSEGPAGPATAGGAAGLKGPTRGRQEEVVAVTPWPRAQTSCLRGGPKIVATLLQSSQTRYSSCLTRYSSYLTRYSSLQTRYSRIDNN